MFVSISNLKADQWKSIFRSVSIGVATMLATLGAISITQRDDLVASVTRLAGAVAEIMVALGALHAIAMAAWGVIKSGTAAQVQSVQEAEPKALTDAVATVQPKILVAAVDAMPDVAGVVTNSTQAGHALAASLPSPTVVAAGTDRAAEVAGK